MGMSHGEMLNASIDMQQQGWAGVGQNGRMQLGMHDFETSSDGLPTQDHTCRTAGLVNTGLQTAQPAFSIIAGVYGRVASSHLGFVQEVLSIT